MTGLPQRNSTGERARLLGVLVVGVCLASGCIEVEREPEARSAPAQPADSPAPPIVASAPAHGFNDEIAWRHLDEGLGALKGGAPMMLVVHASWCGRCKELATAFARDDVAELSRKFVMVNVDQDEIPQALSYAPDGSYIPRVLFFDPSTGAVDPRIKNPRRARHLYYYGPRDDLVGSMKAALERHEPT